MASTPSTSPAIQVVVRRVSAARLAANRRNALKSTGPRTPDGKARSLLNACKSTGPKTPAGKARSSRNAKKHGVWAVETIPPSEHAAFLVHLLGVFRQHQLQTTLEKLWGIAYAHAEWLMKRVLRCRTLGPPGDGNFFDDAARHIDAVIRLEDRLNTLTRWRIRGLEWEKLINFPGVADGRAVLAAMPRPVVRSPATPANAGDGALTEGSEATGPAVLREGSEATTRAVLREGTEATTRAVLREGTEASAPAVLREGSEATTWAVLREGSEATTRAVLRKGTEATALAFCEKELKPPRGDLVVQST